MIINKLPLIPPRQPAHLLFITHYQHIQDLVYVKCMRFGELLQVSNEKQHLFFYSSLSLFCSTLTINTIIKLCMFSVCLGHKNLL